MGVHVERMGESVKDHTKSLLKQHKQAHHFFGFEAAGRRVAELLLNQSDQM
jgi:hypothetical protein